MKYITPICSVFATLFLLNNLVFAESIQQKKSEHSPLRSSAKSLCFASQVRVSPYGFGFYLLNKNSFNKFTSLSSLSGANVDYFDWNTNFKSNDKLFGEGLVGEETKFGPLSIDSRNISFDEKGKVFSKSYFEGGHIYNHDKGSTPNYIKSYDTFGFGDGFSYLNIINFKDIDSELLSVKNDIDTEKNSIFFKTNTFDKLNSVTLLDGQIYKIGSNDGRNLILKMPNGHLININNNIDAVSFSNLHITKDTNGKLLLAGFGLLEYLNERKSTTNNNDFYTQYITYPNGKDVDFAYDKDSLWKITESKNTHYNLLKSEIDNWVKNGWIIGSISGDKKSGHFVLLFENNIVENNKSLVIFDTKRNEKKYFVCDIDETKKIDDEDAAKIAFFIALGNKSDSDLLPHLNVKKHSEILKTGYSVTIKTIGGHNKQVILRVSKNTNRKKIGTLVSFRGGPKANLFSSQRYLYETKLLDEGWEIIEPEYSGAIEVSPIISSRLRKNLKSALRDDVVLIKNYLKRNNAKNTPIIILGGSWGAFEAVELASNFQNANHKLMLIAPAGNYLDPSQRIHNKNYSYNDKENLWRRQVDRAAGMPFDEVGNDSNVVFKNIISKICNMKNVKLYFGGADEIVSKLPWQNLCNKPLNIIEMPNQLHSMSNEYSELIINTAHELTKTNKK